MPWLTWRSVGRNGRLKAETLTQPAQTTRQNMPRPVRLPPLWAFALFAGILFLRAASFDVGDTANYHCYALAFWSGARATSALPHGSCLMAVSSYSALPFHTFPTEYGPLALLAFLPPLILPIGWYNVAYFFEMALIVVGIAVLLERYGISGAGRIWLIYALIGNMALAASRFDVLPAACVVIALLAAQRDRWTWAYASVALGILFKFYPAALLPLLLISSWRARDREPFWRGPAVMVAILAVVEGVVSALNPAAVLAPLQFMGARCVQVESLPATVGYVWAHVSGNPVTYTYAFNAICEQAPTLAMSQMIALALGVAVCTYAIVFYWRRELSLGLAALLILAALVISSKVFSPQYILWLSPLVALEYGVDAAALIGWGAICLWTTLCFPLSYDGVLDRYTHQPPEVLVPVTAGVRNALLLLLSLTTVLHRAKLNSMAATTNVSQHNR